MSPDPLGVHKPGQADLNLYAYVKGRVLQAVDPVGLAEESLQTLENEFIRDKATNGVGRGDDRIHSAAAGAKKSSHNAVYDAELRRELGVKAPVAKLHGDHIVTVQDLRRSAAFRNLTYKQQLEVLNQSDNLAQLGGDINSGIKGGKSLDTLLGERGIKNKTLDKIATRARNSVNDLIDDFTDMNKGYNIDVPSANVLFLQKYAPNSAISKTLVKRLAPLVRAGTKLWRVLKPLRTGGKVAGRLMGAAGNALDAVESGRWLRLHLAGELVGYTIDLPLSFVPRWITKADVAGIPDYDWAQMTSFQREFAFCAAWPTCI